MGQSVPEPEQLRRPVVLAVMSVNFRKGVSDRLAALTREADPSEHRGSRGIDNEEASHLVTIRLVFADAPLVFVAWCLEFVYSKACVSSHQKVQSHAFREKSSQEKCSELFPLSPPPTTPTATPPR